MIAEYLVVRHHVLLYHMIYQKGAEGIKILVHGRGPIGMDIMCFFFVLSWFVMTYMYKHADFSGWKRRKAFTQRRLMQVYPVFLFCWLCACPSMVYQYSAVIRHDVLGPPTVHSVTARHAGRVFLLQVHASRAGSDLVPILPHVALVCVPVLQGLLGEPCVHEWGWFTQHLV